MHNRVTYHTKYIPCSKPSLTQKHINTHERHIPHKIHTISLTHRYKHTRETHTTQNTHLVASPRQCQGTTNHQKCRNIGGTHTTQNTHLVANPRRCQGTTNHQKYSKFCALSRIPHAQRQIRWSETVLERLRGIVIFWR